MNLKREHRLKQNANPKSNIFGATGKVKIKALSGVNIPADERQKGKTKKWTNILKRNYQT